MKKVKFIFGIHNHQPVGNFEWVLEKGYDIAYKPFLDVMLKHKSIKWNLHCSGILWEFLIKKYPAYINTIKQLVKENNLEILSGGYYEPILSVIPKQDQIGQINLLSNFIENTFGTKPQGAWIAERVWEPTLVETLSDANIKYALLDDFHFTATGLNDNDLRGYFISEDKGKTLNIFPISQKLRYFIPFQDVDVCINYFRKLAYEGKETILVMADDGEKFGMWPETNKHVYENGWLEKFLTALEQNSDIVETVTFSQAMAQTKPCGRIYLGTCSYFEMSEWTLLSKAQNNFENLVKQYENNENLKPFIRGGFWRLFLSKYDESNNMHKKMLRLSNKINQLPPKKLKKSKILNALYGGQCNCAYWHGVFGGLYLPHLRNAIYEQLLKAENIYNDICSPKQKWEFVDFDSDGLNEVLYEDKIKNIYINYMSGGTIFEFDILKKNYNLSNVLTRRYEGYHKKLKDAIENNNIADPNQFGTIHSDAVKVKETGLEKALVYDWYRKVSLADHFLSADSSYENLYSVTFKDIGDFVLGEYKPVVRGKELELQRIGSIWCDGIEYKIKVTKIIIPLKQCGYEVNYKITNLSKQQLSLKFAVEQVFEFSEKQEEDSVQIDNVNKWVRKDENLKMAVNVESSANCNFWTAPIETVSNSENGYEKTYQGTTLFNVYNFILEHAESFKFIIKTTIETDKK